MRRAKSIVGQASSMLSLISRMEQDDVVRALDQIDAALLAPEGAQHSGLIATGRFRIELDPAEQPISAIQVYEGRSLLLTIHRDPVPNKRLVVSTTEVVCEWQCTRSPTRRRFAEIVLIGVGIAALRVHHGVPFLYLLERGLGERWPDGTRLVATRSTTAFI